MCVSLVIVILLSATSTIIVEGLDVSFTDSLRTNSSLRDSVLIRLSRQSKKCSNQQWQCRDGSCISFDGKCDGVVDCADRSDETHALCRNSHCQKNWFRCTYGACVDGTAPCNGRQECADNSDELLPRCRNETEIISGEFKCADGSYISGFNYCDGTRDCADGSDETVDACAANTCLPHLFQCAYGACVDGGSDCNKIIDCADSSDELAELCGDEGIVSPTPSPITTKTTTTVIPAGFSKNCKLPEYPKYGTYKSNIPDGKPGEYHVYINLTVTCDHGYGVKDYNRTFCYNGAWDKEIPECHQMCLLKPHHSVKYTCLMSNAADKCEGYQHNGTMVNSTCAEPNYYTPSTLPYITCIDGSWSDTPPKCLPDCGRLTADGQAMVIHGWSAKKGELPWHAGIYTKIEKKPFYMQMCGGTLISRNTIISAAHCFWDGSTKQKMPSSKFAVAMGKVYRSYHHKTAKNNDQEDAQRSDVREIHIPETFYGSVGNYQADIAVMVTVDKFTYHPHVRPACLNLDHYQELEEGVMGKVAGWGRESVNGGGAAVLQVTELPLIPIKKCRNAAPATFIPLLTTDKICAGYLNGSSALCEGDSGGGLMFPQADIKGPRYYLRGIVSTAPKDNNLCMLNTFSTFTDVMKHDDFIKTHMQSD